MTDPTLDLSGRILVATPDMMDPRFTKSVIYVCRHTDEGTMGIVLNEPYGGGLGNLTLSTLLPQIGVKGDVRVADAPVLAGGPVDIDRGFVIHSPDYETPAASLTLTHNLRLTSTRDILDALVSEAAPARAVLAIGYAGWSGGQIEAELAQNAWLVCKASNQAVDDLIFGTNMGAKWASALGEMGITPEMLSAGAGNA